MTRCPKYLLALQLLLLLGCAARRDGAPGPGDQSILRAADFGNYANAFQAVQTLRPGWLRTRAAGSFQTVGQVWVYRDGMRFGDLDRLRTINTVEIDSLRYLDGIAASQRWGLGHENGVIHVFSRVQ
jgi:hypothetical protein